MAHLISVDNLCKVYETGAVTIPALSNVTLSIEAGEFVAIVGASGSGKSTFMNLLGCLDIPSSGKYFLNEEDVQSLKRDELAYIRNHVIGFVFQGFNLLPRHNAVSNVALPLVYAGMSKKARLEKSKGLLKAVGLEGRAEAMPNQLSGGEQQRVAIARAIANNPKLLLADEPTGNLDTHTSQEIMRIFKKLNDEFGITIVLVTHEPDIAACAKRLVRFRDGRVIYDGSVKGDIGGALNT